MSGFFPWNFRAGKSGGGVPATGCPLEDHPVWSIAAGTGPSVLCWDSVDGKSVLVNGDSSDVVNLTYRGISMVDGSIAATIATVSTSAEDWMLPLCGRMINANNLIGARWNNGKFEIVQRKVGTWTSLFSGGPTPALGDRVVFHLSSKFWKLIVNGAVVGEGETTLPDDPGAWGMSQHRAPGFVGHRLFRDYEITDTSLAKTPCMTGPDTPYGEVSASSGADAWLGMDCSNSTEWVSDVSPMPQWIQWIGPAGQPAMVPDRIHVEGNSTDHSPKKITLQGSNDNGQLWDDIHTWDDLDFGSTPSWDASITGSKAYMAIRLQIDEIRAADTCQVSTFTVYGHGGQAALASVAYSGAIVERTDDAVYISDIASGGDSNDRAQLFSGTVLQFDGVGTIIRAGAANLLAEQTMVATVDWDGLHSGYIISTRFDSIGQLSFYISNAKTINVYNSSESISFTLPETLITGNKYRLGITYDGFDCSLFFKGLLVDTKSLGAIINTEETGVYVGARDGAGGLEGLLSGNISNVQIWDAAFTQDDVAFDFANPEKTADQRDGTSLTRANLKGYWPLIDGSGSVAHDWSDNANHGTLTGFATDDSQWLHQQSSPLVPQTALMGWNYLNGVLRPLGQSDGIDFPRDFGELNWNGRSYANAGNLADVNPSTAVIIEAVAKVGHKSAIYDKESVQLYSPEIDTENFYFRVSTVSETIYISAAGSLSDIQHYVCVFSAANMEGILYIDGDPKKRGNFIDDEPIIVNSSNVHLGELAAGGYDAIGQLPLFVLYKDADAQEIIDGDLDAWVAELYQKRVDQGFIPLPVEHNGEATTHNNQPVYYRKGGRQ